MNGLRVEIDRLNITLDGFGSAMEETALEGIERELRRAIAASLPSDEDGSADPAVLRTAIVERTMTAIRRAAGEAGTEAL